MLKSEWIIKAHFYQVYIVKQVLQTCDQMHEVIVKKQQVFYTKNLLKHTQTYKELN